MTENELIGLEIPEILEKFNQLESELEAANIKIELMRQDLATYQIMTYSPRRETMISEGQTNLFTDPSEDISEVISHEEYSKPEPPVVEKSEKKTTKGSKPREKSVGRKDEILNQYVQEDVYHYLPDEEQVCHDCHHPLKLIGPAQVQQELVFVPAHFKCVNHHQMSYKCDHCSSQADKDQFVKSELPSLPFVNSFGSASVVAETIYQKYELKVPAYRQENHWRKLLLPLSRTTICRWHIKACEYYLGFIYRALHDEILMHDIAHMDETTFRVLESDKQQTFYWILQSSQHHDHKVVYFSHQDGRGSDKFKEVIGSFEGTIHCDMYAVYRSADESTENLELAGCWAHLRRKFFEASRVSKGLPKTTADEILTMINTIFRKEREWKELSIEERFKKRQFILKRLMDNLFNYIDQCAANTILKDKLSKAFSYAKEYKAYFYNVLKDGRLELSNNAAERSIRTVVMGRNNYKFAATFNGAQAGAVILSLIETAKLHGLDAKQYIQYLLTHLPNESDLATATLDQYMPWSNEIKEACSAQTVIGDVVEEKTA
ncbi:IS66 family transposase [Fundicoccus culcitae]|uniref:IS66 family transposase n=1 Tax=Fundicoccus culcitae TaxID=2969821 RepID=A0ABY5P6B0_9LACT|nr:IS66 family transposase [Fundicoccus culcitae]UUX33915.1 IS66 family transposase [Fundicoccus culcitae]